MKPSEIQAKAKREIDADHKAPPVRALILGVNDGLVSNLALVAGLSGAVFASGGSAITNFVIILAGVAELVAGAISMGFSTYISVKSEKEYYQSQVAREKQEMKEVPEIEREEIREIYRRRGFEGKELESIVKKITSNEKLWLEVMLTEELGMAKQPTEDPKIAGMHTATAFVIGAFIPVVAFLFLPTLTALKTSIVLTGIALFTAGALKATVTKKPWYQSGLEMLGIGLFAAGAAYAVGALIAGF